MSDPMLIVADQIVLRQNAELTTLRATLAEAQAEIAAKDAMIRAADVAAAVVDAHVRDKDAKLARMREALEMAHRFIVGLRAFPGANGPHVKSLAMKIDRALRPEAVAEGERG